MMDNPVIVERDRFNWSRPVHRCSIGAGPLACYLGWCKISFVGWDEILFPGRHKGKISLCSQNFFFRVSIFLTWAAPSSPPHSTTVLLVTPTARLLRFLVFPCALNTLYHGKHELEVTFFDQRDQPLTFR